MMIATVAKMLAIGRDSIQGIVLNSLQYGAVFLFQAVIPDAGAAPAIRCNGLAVVDGMAGALRRALPTR